MAIIIGDVTLDEATDNGNTFLQVSGGTIQPTMPAGSAANSAGDTPLEQVVTYNSATNYNVVGGGFTTGTGEFIAPRDGIYWAYFWYMIDSSTTQNNKHYDIEQNGSIRARVYTSNGGNLYREAATGVVLQLSEGDSLRARCRTITLYGASTAYTRYSIMYMGS